MCSYLRTKNMIFRTYMVSTSTIKQLKKRTKSMTFRTYIVSTSPIKKLKRTKSMTFRNYMVVHVSYQTIEKTLVVISFQRQFCLLLLCSHCLIERAKGSVLLSALLSFRNSLSPLSSVYRLSTFRNPFPHCPLCIVCPLPYHCRSKQIPHHHQ